MAHNFHYYSPTEVIFGRGAHQETGKYIKKYGGTKVLVVYGSERVFKNGLMDEITSYVIHELNAIPLFILESNTLLFSLFKPPFQLLSSH